MDSFATNNSYVAFISNNTKAQILESTLHKSLDYFKDLVSDFHELYIESENYKYKFVTQKELCERSSCSSSETLKNIINTKNKTIQTLASILTRLNETKNFSLIDEAFRIICGDPTSPKENIKTISKNHTEDDKKCIGDNDISLKEEEESLNEIEGTPTGRKSPIIQSKKLRNTTTLSGKTSDCRDKIKCPDNWSTPEKKSIKLLYPTSKHSKSGGRLRQSRLNLVKLKQTNVVDLTCSPELSGGIHRSRSETQGMQSLVKKESLENDTILPSPTSNPVNFILKANTVHNSSSVKVTKNSLSLKNKKENINKLNLIGNTENEQGKKLSVMEDSINILNQLPKRFQGAVEDLIKIDPIDDDETHCDINSSMSLLDEQPDCQEKDFPAKLYSSSKRPLMENINVTNTPPKNIEELFENHLPISKMAVDKIKRHIPELAESLYKEPVVRKKNEKRALPGWCCDECEHFFGELYKDNPHMIAKKIEECSRHRGRQNPIRPKTPPNFWNPRWSVPDDTEELNRMNNAI